MKNRVKILDGAFGTYKQETGLTSKEIYKRYLEAGVDYLTINGFDLVFEKPWQSLHFLEIECIEAKRALEESSSNAVLLGSLGPTNIMLSMRSDRYKDSYLLEQFYHDVVEVYVRHGVKNFIIETAQDALNIKVALRALYKYWKNGQIESVFVSCVPDTSGYLLDGTHFWSVHDTCVNFPFVKAFGFNCGRGPKGYEELLYILNQHTNLPIIFYPNAGIPINGKYQSVSEFEYELNYIINGSIKVNIIGGCCGTTPEHIVSLRNKNIQLFHNFHKSDSPNIQVIGERLNANGSKKFLKAAQMESLYEISEIIGSQESNSIALDVNVDNPIIEKKHEIYQAILNNTKLDICIDTSDADLRELFQSITPHHTIVNSIALSDVSYLRALDNAMSWGSDIIVRSQHPTLGFGKNLEEKQEIAKLSLSGLEDYPGVLYDICLTPICLDEKSDDRIRDYYHLTKWLKRTYPKVKLCAGISNVSFAFKGNSNFRKLLNVVIAEWLDLDVVIGNPSQFKLSEHPTYGASELRNLLNKCVFNGISITQDLIELSRNFAEDVPRLIDVKSPELYDVLLAGDALKAASLLGDAPLTDLTNAITKVSELYDSGKIQIIQMLVASDTLKRTFKYLTISPQDPKYIGVLCTVKGDIHDIGKDIVKEVITAQGVKVIDLGIDVETDKILEVLNANSIDFIGLSGLISPSLFQMERICLELDSQYDRDLTIFLGGAVLYQGWVDNLQSKLNHLTVKYAKSPTDLLSKLCEQ